MKTWFHPAGLTACVLLSLAGCMSHDAEEHAEGHEARHPIVVTNPLSSDVDRVQKYVCQIHSSQHIEVRALERGYLSEIHVQEGQAVRAGDLMFEILPVVYQARLHADEAELETAQITLRNTETLFRKKVVSDQELALAQAERDRAKAEVELAAAELAFTQIKAPFDGIVDRQYEQQGSLLEEGDMLTTVSDNGVMWVYFNVPETDYLAFASRPDARDPENPQKLDLRGARIELQLANGSFFGQTADDAVTVESTFDNETGNILFRADFANPDRLLRHGQTGTLWIHQAMKDVLVIPQRSTFEILDQQYVYVVGDDGVARQRPISIAHETDDIFVIEDGIQSSDRIVLEGVRQIHDGEHVEAEYREPEDALAHMKHHAE